MNTIRIGIVGFGNLGKAVEKEIIKNKDMKLVGVFTRRNTNEIKTHSKDVKVIKFDEIFNYINYIDVMILCGGSATDLRYQSPLLASSFNIIDSFDTHEKINEHYKKVNAASIEGGKTSIISVGWDPGLFSLIRLLSEAILLNGNSYTFWGKGVSQGHSDALRGIKGIEDAIQYTIPIEDAMNKVRRCENPTLETRDKHIRECYVVAKEGYNLTDIESEIKNMPYYFDEYDTTVNFISKEELDKKKEKLPHGGFVFRSGLTGERNENNSIIEFSLKLDSNPEFTAGILIAYARANYRLNREGIIGTKTILDIPLSYLLLDNNRVDINRYL